MPTSCAATSHDSAKRHHTFESDPSSSLKMVKDNLNHERTNGERSIDEILPEAMLMEILSRLPDSRALTRCAMVNKIFYSSFTQVKVVRFVCKLESTPRREKPAPFKATVFSTLGKLKSVETLRLEIEDEMQSSRFKDEGGMEKNQLWLSETKFIAQWLPLVSRTLQHLTLIDYGQQAIFQATPLLQALSEQCKQLRTLELRNMFLDCTKIEKMNKMTTLTLRCVKLTDNGLEHLNKAMPELDTLTLVTVVGLQEAVFESKNLKVLCLGLATKVKTVRLKVEHLEKLQLKMACPQVLEVEAPDLQCLAVCMDKKDKAIINFKEVKGLRELLMGASEFTTLESLCLSNSRLEKVFLDVPCMAFDDSGGWRGVLSTVDLGVPKMEHIKSCCPNLQTMSVGPGLWYSLENCFKAGGFAFQWPALRRLILHLIVNGSKDSPMSLLTALVKAIPTLAILEVYVHTSSVVEPQEFYQLRSQFPYLEVKCDSWKKGLRFECFSF